MTAGQWVSDNKVGVILSLLLAAVVAAMSALQGCDFGDVVRTKLHPELQRQFSMPATVSLNEGERLFQEWFQKQRLVAETQFSYLDHSRTVQMAFTSFVNDEIMPVAGGYLQNIPFGGAAVGGLGLLAGIFFKQPGSDKRVAAEKEASYAKGRKDLMESLSPPARVTETA